MILLSVPEMGFAKKRVSNKTKGAIISRITVRGTDIFDFESDKALAKFPYTWINALHIKTKEHIIRQELLFKIGEKVDPFLLRETERNLRALSFINSARIAQFPQRDGTTALVVYVSDSWTTEPQINLSGINGVDTVEVGFKEKNLFGFGKTVGVFYNNGDNFIERSYSYTDPRFLGSRWRLDGKAINATDEENRSARLERPFFSADTKWSAFGQHEIRTEKIEEFQDQTQVSAFEQRKEINEVFAGTKLGGSRDMVNRVGLRYRKENRNSERIDETAPNRDLPAQAEYKILFLDLRMVQNNFTELTRIEKMTRVEDFNLGTELGLSPGINPNVSSKRENSHEFQTFFRSDGLYKDKNLWRIKGNYSGRDPLEDAKNERYLLEFRFYERSHEWNTLVINTRAEWGRDLDPDNLIKLGLSNGLRSFEEESIVGAKAWLFNVENRFYFIDELWNLFAVGGVLFYETGGAWDKGEPIALSDLKSEVGTGLRLGLTRSSNEVILRFDVGYRMQKNRGDDPGFVFTFGTGQAF